jgi:hypothetical protein
LVVITVSYLYKLDIVFLVHSISKVGKSRNRKTDNKKFLQYSLYAWTAPLLLTIGVLLNVNGINAFKVDLGKDLCFIDTNYVNNCNASTVLKKIAINNVIPSSVVSAIIYVHGPLLVLLVINFGFFFVTLMYICKTQRQVKSMPTEESATLESKGGRYKYA